MPRAARYRSLDHAHVEALYQEAASEALTLPIGEDAIRWWFIAEQCRLELIRRHTGRDKSRCWDLDCPWQQEG